jgi:hypothetical protein
MASSPERGRHALFRLEAMWLKETARRLADPLILCVDPYTDLQAALFVCHRLFIPGLIKFYRERKDENPFG